MAGWLRYAVALFFALIAGWIALRNPNFWGVGLAIVIFLAGSGLSQRLFDQIASPRERSADLERRARGL